ncbi:MAG: hypothetical protein IH589_11115 [Anaerolineales bacterium]|nr:hypothetical protein [Anaerolineales bacterium]
MNEERKKDELNRLAYETANQHWLHAENIRWTILSNFLTGNSIFILTWAAMLSSSIDGKKFLLGLTALAGLILSFIWIAIEVRSSIFVNQYFLLGKHLEGKLSIKKIGAFNRSIALRIAQNNPPEKDIPVVEPKITYDELQKTENVIEQLFAPIPTYKVVIIIPAVFIAVYIALFIYSVFII